MGGCFSLLDNRLVYTSTYLNSFSESGAEVEDALPRFQVLKSHHEAIIQFELDKSVPSQSLTNGRLIELRTVLGEKISHDILFNYAKKLKRAESVKKRIQLNVFRCWNDIWQLHRSVTPTDPLSFQKAKEVYTKYVRRKELIVSDDLLGVCSEYFELPEHSRANLKDAPQDYLLPLFYFCFVHIYENIFTKFLHSHEYTDMNIYLRANINSVDVGDFKFLSVLGEGSSGLVFECVKRSTNVKYAMKVVQKKSLIQRYSKNSLRVDEELRALVAMRNHPFIVNLAYAFTTNSVAMMALELCVGVDLKHVLDELPDHRLVDANCRFYTAELVSAVAYAHTLGFVCRNLKPGNVMLCSDGHVKLIDLGSCVDLERDDMLVPLSREATKEEPLTTFVSQFNSPLLANYASLHDSVDKSEQRPSHISNNINSLYMSQDLTTCKSPLSRYRRARSVVGTLGYLAPELMELYGTYPESREGYSHASDWWSLGALLYKLYTGNVPCSIVAGMAPLNNAAGRLNCKFGLSDINEGKLRILNPSELSLVKEEEYVQSSGGIVASTSPSVDFMSIGTVTADVANAFVVIDQFESGNPHADPIRLKAMAYTNGGGNAAASTPGVVADMKENEECSHTNILPAFPREIFPPAAVDFISRCLEFDPVGRWRATAVSNLSDGTAVRSANFTLAAIKEVKAHPFFDAIPNFTWKSVDAKVLRPPALPVDVEALRAATSAKTSCVVESSKSEARRAVPSTGISQHVHSYPSDAAGSAAGTGAVSTVSWGSNGTGADAPNMISTPPSRSVTTSPSLKFLGGGASSKSSHVFDRMMLNLGRKDWLISDLNLGSVPLDTGNFNPNYRVPKVPNLNEYLFTAWHYVNPLVVRLEQSSYCPSSSDDNGETVSI